MKSKKVKMKTYKDAPCPFPPGGFAQYKSSPFMDTMDRMYTLCNLHKLPKHPHSTKQQSFDQYIKGKITHVVIAHQGHIHIRFLPKLQTQWLFDSYGS